MMAAHTEISLSQKSLEKLISADTFATNTFIHIDFENNYFGNLKTMFANSAHNVNTSKNKRDGERDKNCDVTTL